MYNEKVMEVFKNPQHMGEVENYNAIGTVGNEVCGDIMQITMRIENNVIKDAKFKTFGCAAAVASSSTATGMIIGKTIQEALEVTNKAVMEALGSDGLLLITADHGCDPCYTATTDHTREYVPLLVLGKQIKPVDLRTRESFADIAATVTELLGVPFDTPGKSFARDIL